MRTTTTRETLAMFLLKWTRKAGGYIQITVWNHEIPYCEADICHYHGKDMTHSYYNGSLDQALHDVDQELGL